MGIDQSSNHAASSRDDRDDRDAGRRLKIMDEHDRTLAGSDEGEADQGEFVQLLTRAQLGLLRYITALTGNADAAGNILQETNLLLWKKADEFQAGTNFDAWATKVAYWQVRAYIRDRGRDRHVFSGTLAAQLAESAEHGTDIDATMQMLQRCLEGMRPVDRDLIALRYDSSFSVSQISAQVGKSPAAVKGALLRTRRALRECIERRRARER